VTESEIQFLKGNIDNAVEIETIGGERLVASVLLVTCDAEYNEHDFTYQVVSTNMPEAYADRESAGGYILDFDDIVAIKPHS